MPLYRKENSCSSILGFHSNINKKVGHVTNVISCNVMQLTNVIKFHISLTGNHKM